ncbi:TasA family protein [Blautia sp.]|uniref:Camelysin metallo-endopeptidase n=1 Tax=Blautia glucerasea TaxID=536633 RepID=A0A6N2SFR2_9FIRM|nr:TasA family protein [uncultured Blautia sp.]
MKKRMVKTLTLFGLIGALTAGGTAAYLTDFDQETNTFTVGKVDIDVEEPNWKPDDHDKIVPTEEMKKDPQITNNGKNDAFVYLEVSIPVRNVITANEDGTRNPEAETELFTFNKNSGWTLLSAKKVGANKVYTYNYSKILKAGETTTPLFQTIKFANIIEGQLDEQSLDVGIRGYAIQAENTGDKENSVDAQAKAAYNKYVNQNKGQNGEALSGNIA